MMRSMYAGVSGLKTHQIRMDVVGNNIANVNTTGYKGSRATFKEMLNQTLQGAKAPQGNRGGMNPQQVGLGVMLGSIDTNQTQGNLQSTGLGTDLAIQGNGYFVINNGQQNLYTRAGNLTLDEQGNLVNSSNGYIMQGWEADNNGIINSNLAPEGVRIPLGATMNAQATENAFFTGNFNSEAAGGATWTATIDVLDSLGSTHTVGVDFVRQVSAAPTGQADFGGATGIVDATSSAVTPELNGLTIKFGADSGAAAAASYDASSNTITVTADWDNSGGNQPAGIADIHNAINTELGLEGFTDTVTMTSGGFDATEFDGAPDIVLSAAASNDWDYTVDVTDGTMVSGLTGSINFDTAGVIASGGTSTITFDPTGGAAPGQDVVLDFNELTQNATASEGTTVQRLYADGYEMGSLESFSIDNGGVITGSFSNGLTRALGQIAVANFSNPSGLTKQGDTLFAESQNSGMPQIGTAASGGRGKISSGTLEMSNVDLAEQFTDMITTQRGFQANSKIITTADQMLQELVNLKR